MSLDKHYRRPEVESLTGLSRTSIYRMMNAGKFPRPVRMSEKVVAWKESGLKKWLDGREKSVAA